MIASFPTLSPEPTATATTTSTAAPAKDKPATPEKTGDAAAPPDFSSLIALALGGPPEKGDGEKGVKEKTPTKPKEAAKIEQPANATTLAAGTIAPELPATMPNVTPTGPSLTANPETIEAVATETQSGDAPPPRAGDAKDSTPVKDTAKGEKGAKTRPTSLSRLMTPTSGMTVAPKEARMKSTVEQNEIAQPTAQKLPSVTAISSAAAIRADAPAAKSRLPIEFSSVDSAERVPLFDASKTIAPTATTNTVETAANVQAAGPAHRVEQLISREVVSFKKTGAEEVGVSLKIDAHTQLFLHLSYRDGQTQAELRCEQGDLPALSAHFSQLQESLARQNIHLEFSPNGNGGFSGGNDGEGRRQQFAGGSAEPAMPGEGMTATLRKPKTRIPSRQGFESWA